MTTVNAQAMKIVDPTTGSAAGVVAGVLQVSGGGGSSTPDDLLAYTTVLTHGADGVATITKTYTVSGAVSTRTFSYTAGKLTGVANVVT